MYKVKKLNNIADIVNKYLGNENFELTSEGEDYDAALVRSADMHSLALPENLLAVARAGAGTNNIPIPECSEKGIVVFNTPGANANAVKELVICGMLLAGRDVLASNEWLKAETAKGTKDIDKVVEKAKNNFVGPELTGKKLGVIGLGAIGVLVANAACNGLGMEVIGYDPYMSVDAAWHLTRAVKLTPNLDDILTQCDFITIHVPLNDKTRNTIAKDQIAKMKDGAVVLNFARGPLVNDEDIAAALESGKIAHYVTDFPNDFITGKKGVIAIPHLGASTPESEDNCAKMAAKQLRNYLIDGNIKNSVNMPECVLPKMDGVVRIAIINKNITNMVGQITSVLAQHKHNIEHMLNKSRGDYAYTLIDVTDKPSAECIAELSKIDGVIRVRVID